MKHLKSVMRFHKNNGHRDDTTGKNHGANPDKVVNAHILGSDILMITFGDMMQYHLVRCDPPKGQDYRFTQKNVDENKNCTNLAKTIPLCHGSLYVHTAHDDETNYHGLDFSKQLVKRNRVCVALVYRCISVPMLFRQSSSDARKNRYSAVD